ncbi:hypothetical protein [Actinoallomurus rhizosphaericola]|uniref:hypothetical protein n=1 Tax=Actinoallomurus rhizosphaericola TaxID=2952536 RepID=UPI0020927C3F|nr:hypothetical protein [Actinoallomurus rhizosphaericola]MCO5995026.1 hypothetical protein [Actinoallomurus rhizosphaericola]
MPVVDMWPDRPADLGRYGCQSGSHDESGDPMLRLVAVVASGTRTLVDAVFGAYATSELTDAQRLPACLRPGMVLLADRTSATADLIGTFAATGADLLVRRENLSARPPRPV